MEVFRTCLVIFLLTVFARQETSAFDLECEFANFTGGMACMTHNVRIRAPNQTVTTINNQTSSFYRNKNVKFLIVQSQVVNFMPKGIATFFPMLEELEISGSKLKSIKQQDLKPFKSLRKVFFFDNDIEKLDSDLFQFNPEVRVIAFDDNELKFVGKNILKPLKKLVEASFRGRGNSCIFKFADTPSQISELIAELEENCQNRLQ